MKYWQIHHAHNGKLPHGFDIFENRPWEIYSPDNKIKFDNLDISGNTMYSKKSEKELVLPDDDIKNMMVDDFYRLFNLHQSIRENGYMSRGNTRKTYHSKLTTKTSRGVLSTVLNPEIIASGKNVTIDEVILDPALYLKKELLDKMGNNLSEGNVFYFLKKYVEDTFDSVSIDRNKTTHTYVLVDDNAFDDLLNSKTKIAANDTKSTELVETYGNYHSVRLNEFFSPLLLAKLGISSSKVVVDFGKNTKTEMYVDANGIVVIGINTMSGGKTATDAEIIDRLCP